MHRIATLVRACAVLLVLCSGVQAVNAQPQRRGLPAPKAVVFPATAVEVPMHRYENLPIVEATINGKGPYRLVVDTGASGMVVQEALAETLDLPSPPGMPEGMRVQVKTPGGPVAARLLSIDELRIGDFQVQGLWLIATALPFGDAIDGVISMSVFRSGLLTFDYPGERFVLHRGALPEANGRDVFSYTTPQDSGSHPTIEMIVGDEPVEFFIDSGFRGWFSGSPAWAETLQITAGPVESRRALTAGGSVPRQIARVGRPISLGPHVVRQPVVDIDPEGEASPVPAKIVGSSFLEHFVVTVDGTNDRIQLAGPETSMTPPAVRCLGLGLKQVGDVMEVWSVHPGAHASSLGLVEGDRIHAFNGRPAVALYRSSEWEALVRTSETITVTYAPGGAEPTRDVQLRVLELLPDV